jgi:uncharacterized coiled-coil protein SlyX
MSDVDQGARIAKLESVISAAKAVIVGGCVVFTAIWLLWTIATTKATIDSQQRQLDRLEKTVSDMKLEIEAQERRRVLKEAR